MSIDPVNFSLPAIETPLLKGSAEFSEGLGSSKSGSFGEILGKAMGNLRDVHTHAAKLTEEYASGGDVDISEVMVASEKASIATELAVQIRNKFVDSYNEIMRMQM
jgi:flagellar hook-basal body complex protein FliE